ncbi:hypothetical protein [Corynebacterium sp. TAE3-ERU30]|uniref:hypothetical protein n=1 Tax=Corynebacterium sp. TAE3-ERU30 TaxID=2849496 RepID=UPI001C456330|nr:hypothetical protein [Corynebacterium sp. TAE3-ERU30]MBV7282281.1 hypothetical protein [Corynebacterium sp. TAE3-ERU30]
MSRYFTALLTFMFVLVIVGLMFDGFESQQGIVMTVIFSLVGAGAAYMLVSKSRKGEE